MAIQFTDEDRALDEKVDRWTDGVLDALHRRPPANGDADYLAGYDHGTDQRRVVPVLPARPEGYYHMPLEG